MKIFILCPAGAVSGGPEALHQLAGALRAKDVDASLVYYPAPHPVPEPYRHYNVTVSAAPQDHPDAVIIIPEVATSLAWRFPQARKAIWWLSVDNYFKYLNVNPGPSVFDPHPGLMHLCQSHYALDFLARQGAGPRLMLSDYLTQGVFTPGPTQGRLPAVAYNPKKAPETTRGLIGNQIWLPLENLSKPALADLLREVRIYVDFGPHPGRDRIPREAALCGAVVITGRRGAAAFAADIPLPDRFRLDEAAADFDLRARALIAELLESEAVFAEASAQQEPYRRWIAGNHQAFLAEADAFLGVLSCQGRSQSDSALPFVRAVAPEGV